MLLSLSIFAKQVIQNPTRVGAAAPSGRQLARLMAQGLGPDSGQIVEIGPGTGSLTRGILAAGVPEDNLVLVEINPEFCQILSDRFPRARVVCAQAQDLPNFNLTPCDRAISGLPLLNFSITQQTDILKSVFSILRSGAALVQFTYGPRAPIAPIVLAALDLDCSYRGRAWRNLPPAGVYEFRSKNA